MMITNDNYGHNEFHYQSSVTMTFISTRNFRNINSSNSSKCNVTLVLLTRVEKRSIDSQYDGVPDISNKNSNKWHRRSGLQSPQSVTSYSGRTNTLVATSIKKKKKRKTSSLKAQIIAISHPPIFLRSPSSQNTIKEFHNLITT